MKVVKGIVYYGKPEEYNVRICGSQTSGKDTSKNATISDTRCVDVRRFPQKMFRLCRYLCKVLT